MKRRYAVQSRDLAIRPCVSRKAARLDQHANGGLVVTRKGTGVWTPYRRFGVVLGVVRLPLRLLSPRTGEPGDDACLARIRQLRDRIPALVFDVDIDGDGTTTYFIILPGVPRPFKNATICGLITAVEEWMAVENVARLLGEPGRS